MASAASCSALLRWSSSEPQANSGTGAAVGCRPNSRHLAAFAGLSPSVTATNEALFLEAMCPASVVKKNHPLKASLHFIDLTRLQQLHRVHHEGSRLFSTACLKNRRDHDQSCLLFLRLGARRIQLEVLQIIQGAKRRELYALGIVGFMKKILNIAGDDPEAPSTGVLKHRWLRGLHES